MPETDILIRTKVHAPFTRQEIVPRPRLQARVAEGLRRPLTLIVAPAGFGKTTLVASCVTQCEMPIAWLSLDRDDNEEERFLRYLVAALQEVDRAIGNDAARLLAAAREVSPETVLISLINDLVTIGSDIVQVIDDYQLIHSQAVHGQVAFLLDHCPKTLHLVIATRSDPPLALTRLRARGQMVELRGADLRFTGPEAAQFLNDVMGLHLGEGAVAALEERTEGWIAGLQMAALALQGALARRDRQDVGAFIAGFSGTNRYVLDYLLAEVLAGQPPEIERFLLHTSILERLSAPLCAAVIGRQGAGELESSAITESGDQGTGESGTGPASLIPRSPGPIGWVPARRQPRPAAGRRASGRRAAMPLCPDRRFHRHGTRRKTARAVAQAGRDRHLVPGTGIGPRAPAPQ